MSRSLSQLWEMFEPVVQGLGYALVEIEYQPNPKHGVLRLYIDREDGDIQLDDCTTVSHQISALLDVEEPLPGRFNLEVSSPGLDRPLRKIEDFQKFIGEIVKLKTSMALAGQRNFKGQLLAVENDELVLDCDHKQIRVPHAAIDKARLVPNFD
jgi:ribosome maturation factor RimP